MTEVITLTDKAKEEVIRLYGEQKEVTPETGLRIAVVGGGCSGLSYKIDFDKTKEKDHVMDLGTLKVFIDPKSSIYLKGVVLDYQDGLQGKGFVFNNPAARNTCGCGESFSV